MSNKKQHTDLEVVQKGFANGVAPGFPLNDRQKDKMIKKATKAYAKFLEALKVIGENDPNSADTPRRVAKAYVNDLWAGRYSAMVLHLLQHFQVRWVMMAWLFERGIPLTSQCVHIITKQLKEVSFIWVTYQEKMVK